MISQYYPTDQAISILASIVFNRASRENGDMDYLTGRISIVGEDDAKECYMDYKNYIFIRKKLDITSLEQLITGLFSDEGISIDKNLSKTIRSKEKNYCHEILIPSLYNNNDWPIRRLEITMDSNGQYREGPLIAYGLQYYENPEDLIKPFTGISQFSGNNDASIKTLYLDIPDQRGKIITGEGVLGYKTSETTEQAHLTGMFKSQDKTTHIGQEEDRIECDLEHADAFEIFLINKNNEVLDFIWSSHWQYGAHLNKTTTHDEVLASIQSGESETCEFKEYIECSNGATKARQLEKTVCAFSNHRGGKLFIGVNDNAEIIGITSGINNKHYKGRVDLYIEALKKRLSETLSISDCYTIEPISIGGETLIQITVRKTNRCNMTIVDNVVYRRIGANSRKATPEEIAELEKQSDQFNR